MRSMAINKREKTEEQTSKVRGNGHFGNRVKLLGTISGASEKRKNGREATRCVHRRQRAGRFEDAKQGVGAG